MIDKQSVYRGICEKLAAAPSDFRVLYQCAAAARDELQYEFIALLEAQLQAAPSGDKIRLYLRHLLIIFRDLRERAKRGLPRYASTLADTGFPFSAPEIHALIQEAVAYLQKDPSSFPATLLYADAMVNLGEYAEAEKAYAAMRELSGDQTAIVTSFDPIFHATLPEIAAATAHTLVPLRSVHTPSLRTPRAVFAAADHRYFQKYGWEFVDTFVANASADIELDLHIFDLTPQEEAVLANRLQDRTNLRWSLSTEWTQLRDGNSAAARGYYHAVRFVRFWQKVTSVRRPTFLLDIDTTFNADVRRMFDALAEHDLLLWMTPGRFEPRNKIAACCFGVAETEKARAYLRNVSGYIGHFQRAGRLVWGIDQVALFTVLIMTGGESAYRIAPVSPLIADGDRGPNAILWAAKGS